MDYSVGSFVNSFCLSSISLFNFPIGRLLKVHATDETENGKPVNMIRKVERKEGKKEIILEEVGDDEWICV